MAEISLAILGMNRVGASVGLAVRRYNQLKKDHHFKVTGYDLSQQSLKTAKQMGAIDETANRIETVVVDQNIVVLTMPYNEIQVTYEIIAPLLNPGTVIIDMTSMKQKSLNCASEYLREGTHVVCAEPIINPRYVFDGLDELERASADYFDDSSMLLMPSPSCVKEAVNLATDFTALLGAEPLFFDPAEYDALMSATKVLPTLLGVAYYDTLSKGHGWDDAQRLTGADFGMLTHHLFDTHPDDLTALWLDSRDDLIRNLDALIANLSQVREAVQERDRNAIEALLERSAQTYEVWVNRRYKNRWQISEQFQTEAPTFGSMMGSFVGGFMNRGNKKDEE